MGKKKRSRKVNLNIVRVPFQGYVNQAMTSGAYQFLLNPTALGNAGSVYTAFDLYRVVRLEYMFTVRVNGATDSSIVVGYYPDAVMATAPASTGQALENLDAIIQMDSSTVNSKWHRVPPTRLRGQLSWYKCVADASDAGFENQGILQFTGSGTESTSCVIRGIIEFKNPVDAAVSLERMRAVIRTEIMQEALVSAPKLPKSSSSSRLALSALK